MAIPIRDYKTTHSSGHPSGLIPTESIGLNAQALAGFNDTLNRTVDVAAEVSHEMGKVVKIGSKIDLTSNLADARKSHFKKLSQRSDIENAAREWSASFRETIEPLIKDDITGLSRVEINALVDEADAIGQAEINAFAQINMIQKSRSSWQQNLQAAEKSGDIAEVDRSIDQGRGIFIPPAREEEFKREAHRNAFKSKYIDEARANPFKTITELEQGGHPLAKDPELREQVYQEARQRRTEIKSIFASTLLTDIQTGGQVSELGLKVGRETGILSDEQIKGYEQALKGRAADGPDRRKRDHQSSAVLSEWIRKIDERPDDDEAEADLAVRLVFSGLPADDLRKLADRMTEPSPVSRDVTSRVSRQLAASYYGGVWGAPGDRVAMEQWRRHQDEMREIARQEGKDVEERINQWALDKKKESESIWVDYKTIKETRAAKPKQPTTKGNA